MKKGKKTILALTAALCMSAAVAGFAACGDSHKHVDVNPQDGICDECGEAIEGYVPSTGYTVTFDTQGGSAVSPQGVTAGGKAVKPGDPTKPGKVFAGWYKDAACTDGQEFDFNAAIGADVTVYAKWTEAADTADTYFNFADVEGGVSISLKAGQTLPADVKLPAKHENKDVVAIAAQAFEEQKAIRSITIPTSVKSIATRAFRNCTNLAAVAGAENVEEIGASAFAGTKYETDLTVGEVYIGKTFYKYGGSLFADTAITVKDGTLGIAAGAFQSLAKLTGITLPAGLTNIGSYAFGGTGLSTVTIPDSVTKIADNAFRDAASLKTVTLGSAVTSVGATAFSGCPVETVTVKAENAPTAGANILGLPATFDGVIFVPAAKVSAYKAAAGWSGYADRIISATAQKRTVTFNVGTGATAVEAQTLYDGLKPTQPAANPTRDGYFFKGWVTTENGDTPFDFTAPITGNTTVYAKWAEAVTITFNTGNGGSDIAAQVIEKGTKATQPATNPTRDGYIFKGWVTEEDGDTPFNFNDTLNNATTVYAKWVEAITVTFNTGDGGSEVAAQTIEKGAKATKPKNDPTRDGYIFKGWVTADGGSDAFDFTGAVQSNTTVYAKWAEAVTVTFNVGGAPGIDSKTVGKGDTIEAPQAPDYRDHLFGGWYKDSDCTEEFDFGQPITGDTTIYAKWYDYLVKGGWTIAGGKVISYKGSMTTMELPKEVTYLESILDIFTTDNYDECTTFTVEDGSTSFKMDQGALLSYDGKTLYGFFGDNGTTLAWNTVEEIKPYAFYGKLLFTINSLSFEKLEKIGEYAFYGCNGLKSFAPFEKLTEIPAYAFSNCNNLESINSAAKTVGMYAFISTNNLQKVTFTEVVTMEKGAFQYSGVMDFTLPACIETIADGALSTSTVGNANFKLTFLGETPPAKAAATMFKSGMTTPFSGSIFVPTAEAVTAYKAAAAFADVKDHIKKTPTASEEWTIDENGKVTDYTGDMTTVELPADVRTMDSILDIFKTAIAFVKCTSFTVASDNATFEMLHGALVDKTNHATIYAYFGTDETSLDFSTVTKIKPYAFYGRLLAENSKTFSVGTITELGAYAFFGCSGLTDFTPFTSLTAIPDFAFQGSGLTSITTAATQIGQYAFAWLDVKCSNFTAQMMNWVKKTTGTLQSVTLTGTNIEIGANAFYARDNEITATFTIQNKVKSVGANAFYFCTGLKDWTPFDDLETVPAAFSKTGFTSLTIKAKVIEAGAFQYCKSLTTVVLSNPDLESIGKEAFQLYESVVGATESPLQTVTIKATKVPTVTGTTSSKPLGYPFGDQYFKGTIYVRGNLLEQYEKADSWKFYYEHKYYQSGTWRPQTGAVDHSQFAADQSVSKFNVTFDSNEGSAVTQQEVWEYGTAQRPEDPTRLGYVFKGWYTDETWETEYNFTEPVTAAIELHAKWEEGWIVTFKWYDTEQRQITVEKNGTVTKPEDPTREGWFFETWVTAENGEEAFKFGETVITGATTIYAKWTQGYTVQFNTGEDGSEVESQLVKSGEHATKPAQNPTRDGWFFDKWVTSEGGDEEFNFSEQVITGETTVYAKWKQGYTVSFNTGDEGSEVESQTVREGGHAQKPSKDPTTTKEGWFFDKWVTEDGGDVEFNFSEQAITGDVTIYAKWVEGITITFETGEGTPVTEQKIKPGTRLLSVPGDPTREGYRFDGWYTEAEGAGTKVDLTTKTFDAATTLHAKWVQQFTVTFETGEGGSVVDSQVVDINGHATRPTKDPTRRGFDFEGWYTQDGSTTEDWGEEFNFEGNAITQDTKVYAKWAAKAAWDIAEDGTLNGYYGSFSSAFELPATVKTMTNISKIFGDVNDGTFETNYAAFKAANVSFTVAGGNENFKIENDALLSKDGTVFYFYLGATAPDWSKYSSVTTWLMYSFAYNSAVTEATLSNGKLATAMFYKSGLTKATINGTATLANNIYTFKQAESFKSLTYDIATTIPSTLLDNTVKVTDLTLGENCTATGPAALMQGVDKNVIVTILKTNGKITLGVMSFTSITPTIYVPDALVDTYKADSNWNKFTIKPASEKAAASALSLPEAILPEKKN